MTNFSTVEKKTLDKTETVPLWLICVIKNRKLYFGGSVIQFNLSILSHIDFNELRLVIDKQCVFFAKIVLRLKNFGEVFAFTALIICRKICRSRCTQEINHRNGSASGKLSKNYLNSKQIFNHMFTCHVRKLIFTKTSTSDKVNTYLMVVIPSHCPINKF